MSKRHTALVAVLGVALPAAVAAQTVLTLREAVALALRNDPRLLEAGNRQQAARREANLTRARFGPNVFTGTGATYTSGFPQTASGTVPPVFQVSFTQTVFDPPARGQSHAAVWRANNQELEASSVRDTVTLDTVSTYLELATVRRAIERMRGASDSARRIVDIDVERMREGRLLPIDLLQARLVAAQVQQRLVSLEGRESVLDGQLRLLTGLRSPDRLVVAAEELPAPPERSLAELIAAATAGSPEVRAAEGEERARAALLAGQRGAYWPTVDVVGNYARFSRLNNIDEFFARFEPNSVNVGVEARVPIFNAQTGAAVAVATSQLVEARAAVRRRRDEVEMQVRDAAFHAGEADAQFEVSRVELAIAQETTRLTAARAEEGRADRRAGESALVGEARAWDAFWQAAWARQNTQLQLRRVTGELGRLFP